MSKLITLTLLSRFWTNAKNYIDTALNGKVAKVDGKGLSTNDLTASLKANYDAAYTHSQTGDVHVTATQKATWDGKAEGNHTHTEYADADHNHDGAYAAKSHGHAYADLTGKPTIPTTVAQLTDAADYAKKSEIAGAYRYKGSVATVGALPTTGNVEGDVYNVEADGSNHAWAGTAWDNLGGSFTIETATEAEIDALFA